MVDVIGVTSRLRTLEKAETLDDLLLHVIDETLRRIFKDAGAEAIYGYLSKNHHLKQQEICEKSEVFSAGLESLLSSGALAIEKVILKNLYSELGFEFEEKEDYKLPDYIRELRESVAE